MSDGRRPHPYKPSRRDLLVLAGAMAAGLNPAEAPRVRRHHSVLHRASSTRRMLYWHAASCGPIPSCIRVVGGCAASWTMAARTCRRDEPVTTARIGVSRGTAKVSPLRSVTARAGVSRSAPAKRRATECVGEFERDAPRLRLVFADDQGASHVGMNGTVDSGRPQLRHADRLFAAAGAQLVGLAEIGGIR